MSLPLDEEITRAVLNAYNRAKDKNSGIDAALHAAREVISRHENMRDRELRTSAQCEGLVRNARSETETKGNPESTGQKGEKIRGRRTG